MARRDKVLERILRGKLNAQGMQIVALVDTLVDTQLTTLEHEEPSLVELFDGEDLGRLLRVTTPAVYDLVTNDKYRNVDLERTTGRIRSLLFRTMSAAALVAVQHDRANRKEEEDKWRINPEL